MLARDVAGVIDADETWSGTIQVTADVTVPDGVKLTIDPGTVVKIQNNRWLQGIGTVDAIGTAANPIVFTSVQDDSVGEDLTTGVEGAPAAGHWRTPCVRSGDWSMQHAEVRFAGRSGVAAINVNENFDATENGTSFFRDVAVANSGNIGIELVSGDSELTRVNVTGSANVAIHQNIPTTPTYSSVTISGNAGGDHIRLGGGSINDDRVWDFGGLPTHLDGTVVVKNPGSLTIAPGSVIKILGGNFLHANSGPILAQGTTAEPIVITSIYDDTAGGDSNADGDATTASPGNWRTLFLYHGDSKLENVDLRYAGRSNEGQFYLEERVAGTDGAGHSRWPTAQCGPRDHCTFVVRVISREWDRPLTLALVRAVSPPQNRSIRLDRQ